MWKPGQCVTIKEGKIGNVVYRVYKNRKGYTVNRQGALLHTAKDVVACCKCDRVHICTYVISPCFVPKKLPFNCYLKRVNPARG